MDKILLSMANKLNGFDEASLMNLWQKYAQQVHEFEPTKRWEEAALVLCFIQAVQWKNRLFNYHVLGQSQGTGAGAAKPEPVMPNFAETLQTGKDNAKPVKKAVILSFPEKKS